MHTAFRSWFTHIAGYLGSFSTESLRKLYNKCNCLIHCKAPKGCQTWTEVLPGEEMKQRKGLESIRGFLVCGWGSGIICCNAPVLTWTLLSPGTILWICWVTKGKGKFITSSSHFLVSNQHGIVKLYFYFCTSLAFQVIPEQKWGALTVSSHTYLASGLQSVLWLQGRVALLSI